MYLRLCHIAAGMSPTEQDLACLHADALSSYYRLELKAGVLDAQAKAQAKQHKMMETTQKRDADAAIWGARTTKEKRLDESRLQHAAKVPSNNVVSVTHHPLHCCACAEQVQCVVHADQWGALWCSGA